MNFKQIGYITATIVAYIIGSDIVLAQHIPVEPSDTLDLRFADRSRAIDMPMNYRTPEALSAEMRRTLQRTRDLIFRYESEGKTIQTDFATIGADLTYKGDPTPRIRFKYEVTNLTDFMAEIAGIDLESSSFGPGIPCQYKSLVGVKNLLDYYDTHAYNSHEVYVYWQVNVLWRYTSSLIQYVPENDLTVDLGEEDGIWLWGANDEKVIEKWPDSKTAAILELEDYAMKIQNPIHNILNKPTITDLKNEENKEITHIDETD